MFQAYNVCSIASKLPLGIESISSDGKTFYGATKTGSLVSYSQASDQSSYSLYVCKNFLPKAINQLKVVHEFSLIIALCEGQVTLHDCSQVNYPIIHSIQKVKNVGFFAAECLSNLSIGNTTHKRHLCLCLVSKRKIHFFYLHEREFIEMPQFAETTYADNIKAATWCPDGQLALAIRDEYFMLSVFGCTDKGEPPGNTKYLFTTGNRLSTPIIKPLLNLRIVGFCRDETMYFVTLEGRSAESAGYSHVRWSQIPNAVEYDYPFLLAMFNSSIEIRSLKPSQLIQTIDMNKPQLISWGSRKCLHVVSNPNANLIDVFCLEAHNMLLRSNVQQLIQDKEYQLACQLAENIDDDKSNDEKLNRINDLKNLYAFHLYSQRRFKDAMHLFEEIDAEVLYVIGLFPDLLPEEVRKRVIYPGPLPTDFAKNEQTQGLQALAVYLSMVRTNIARRLDAYQKQRHSGVSPVHPFLEKIVDEKSESQQKNLLQIVDTTLLKCYLQTNDMLVASLLRLPDNRCDVLECENILTKHCKFNELFLLYERKQMHEKALELLYSQHKLKDSPLRGISRTVQYLQNLGNSHLPLILQYCRWVFKTQPDEAFKIFTEDYEEVKGLDRRRVLDFLVRESPDHVIPYLEHIINNFNEDGTEFKDALVRQCFAVVKKEMSLYVNNLKGKTMAPAGQEPGTLGLMRSNLLKYLDLSSKFNAEVLLNELPEDVMHEERAALLGQAEKHSQAIAVYTNVLHDFKKAEAYCNKKHKPDSSPNLFLLMLSSYAKPENLKIGSWTLSKLVPNVKLATKVLREHAMHFDVTEALKLLPVDMKFEELWLALEPVLYNLARRKNSAQIKNSLHYSMLLMTQKDKMKAQNVKILIKHDTQCAICHKRIGASAFVFLKTRSLVHYYCFPDKKATLC